MWRLKIASRRFYANTPKHASFMQYFSPINTGRWIELEQSYFQTYVCMTPHAPLLLLLNCSHTYCSIGLLVIKSNPKTTIHIQITIRQGKSVPTLGSLLPSACLFCVMASTAQVLVNIRFLYFYFF